MEEMNLNELNVPGYIRFSIKARDTPENEEVHSQFKLFCEKEADNNYTLGLKMLLSTIDGDFKYQLLYDIIQDLELRIAQMEQPVQEKPKVEGKELF